jgi:nucleoside-diphosphate-sugar epimerase
MGKILVVGCGDLGSEIIKLLNASGHNVVGLRASNKKLPNDIPYIQGDVTYRPSLKVLEALFPDIIIYCISADKQSDDSYKAHYVDGLRNVLSTQNQNTSLQHVFFISSTRVYGQSTNELLNENVPAMPNDFGGKRLLEAESLLMKLSCNATVVRLAGIYGPGRLYLVNMARNQSRWPKMNKWTSRIHRDDAAGLVAFLCQKVLRGREIHDCYIGTDDRPASLHEVLCWLAEALNVKVSGGTERLPISGKRLSNQRLHDAGFQLKYPNYQIGYHEVLKHV